MEPFLCFPLELKQWLSFAAVPELSIDNRTGLPLRLPDLYLLSMPNLIATYYSIASRPLISNICLFMVHLYVYTWVCVWYMHLCVKRKANFKCPVLSLCPFSFLRHRPLTEPRARFAPDSFCRPPISNCTALQCSYRRGQDHPSSSLFIWPLGS